MIFRPHITAGVRSELKELDELRRTLSREVERPARWVGRLRRSARAVAIGSSTSIEGYTVSPAEADRLSSGGAPTQPADPDQQAVACYARAMDHVAALAEDPSFRWLDRVILDLHFDTCWFQPDKRPGRWRTGPIGVTGPDGRFEFRGPDAELVPGLMNEVVESLADPDPKENVVVQAAMAHLNLTSVHPFADGNGRVARILQSLVLAREGQTTPELLSIEEYLGEHTARYYAALREVQGGGFNPERDTSKWIAFCVEAHLDLARRRLGQVESAANRWELLEALLSRRGWPDRFAIALEQALAGGTERGRYAEEAEVSTATASSDLRRLLEADLLAQSGQGRSTTYEATDTLRDALD
jgi:Fic family protein